MPGKMNMAVPVLTVENLDQAIEFYKNKLGFELLWSYGEPATHASLKRDLVEINLHSGPRNISQIYIYMDDLDSFYKSLDTETASIIWPLDNRAYGMRDCRIEDLDGNQISFGAPTMQQAKDQTKR